MKVKERLDYMALGGALVFLGLLASTAGAGRTRVRRIDFNPRRRDGFNACERERASGGCRTGCGLWLSNSSKEFKEGNHAWI